MQKSCVFLKSFYAVVKAVGFWKKDKIGGSAWESNPPETVLTPHTGFEVREPHQ